MDRISGGGGRPLRPAIDDEPRAAADNRDGVGAKAPRQITPEALSPRSALHAGQDKPPAPLSSKNAVSVKPQPSRFMPEPSTWSYQRGGIDLQSARAFVAAGIGPDEAVAYKSALIETPEDVSQFKKAGVTADKAIAYLTQARATGGDALALHRANVPPHVARDFEITGVSVADTCVWDRKGVSASDAGNYTRLGLHGERALAFRAAGFKSNEGVHYFNAGFNRSQAVDFGLAGGSAQRAAKLTELEGVTPEIALAWQRAKPRGEPTELSALLRGPAALALQKKNYSDLQIVTFLTTDKAHVRDAARYQDVGLNPDESIAYLEAGISPEDAKDFKGQGFTPEQVLDFAEAGGTLAQARE